MNIVEKGKELRLANDSSHADARRHGVAAVGVHAGVRACQRNVLSRLQRFRSFAATSFLVACEATRIIRVVLDGRRVVTQENLLEGKYGRIRDVAEGPDGYLYFSTSNHDGRGTPAADDDRIIRLVPVK